MKPFFPTLLGAAVTIALLGACSPTDSTQPTAASKPVASSTSGNATNASGLSSKAGDITLPANLSKIAVLDYTSLDTLNALGAADKVVGLPLASTVPTELAAFKDGKYADFGAVNNINLEKLAAAAPELIISADRLEKQNPQFKQIAPTYHYSLDLNRYWQSFHEQTLNLAKMVGKTSEAEQQLKALDEQAAAVTAKAQGKTALIVMVNNDKLMAFGAQSRFGLIHDKLGFKPIDDSIKVGTHGQSISHEFITEKNPDYLFVIDRASAVTGEAGGAQAALDNDIIKQSKAYKEQNIVYLNAADWYLVNGGLNAMGKMIAEVAKSVQ